MDKEHGSSRAGGERALRSRSLGGEEKALGSGKPHVSPAPLSPWGSPPPVLPPRKSPAQPGMGWDAAEGEAASDGVGAAEWGHLRRFLGTSSHPPVTLSL